MYVPLSSLRVFLSQEGPAGLSNAALQKFCDVSMQHMHGSSDHVVDTLNLMDEDGDGTLSGTVVCASIKRYSYAE